MRSLTWLALGITFVSSSATLAAQADAPSNPNIYQAVQQLQLNEAQQAAVLQNIQGALQGLIPAASNTETTIPLVTIGGVNNFIQCSAINLSTEARPI